MVETTAANATEGAPDRRKLIAVVYADKLGDRPSAIAAWQRVMKDFGAEPETVGALADL